MRLIKARFSNRGVITDSIQGNLQDEVTATIEFEQEYVTFASGANKLFLTPDPYVIGTTDNVNVIYTEQSDGFKYVRIFDILEIVNVGVDSGNWRVVQILDTQTVRVERVGAGSVVLQTASFSEPTTPSGRVIVGLSSDLGDILYQYNIIPINEPASYESLNGSEIKYTCTSVLNTPVAMLATSDISQMQGTATCEWYGLANTYLNRFRITHTFRIFDFYKELYFDKLSNGILLDDWQDGYRFVFKIQQKRPDESTYREDFLSYEEEKGSLGGYNQNFNTGQNYFKVDNLQYKNGSAIVDSLEINKVNDVKFRIKSSRPISPTACEFEASFVSVQEDLLLLNDSSQSFLQNRSFSLSSESSTCQDGSIADYGVFKTPLTLTVIDANTVEVSTQIELGSKVKDNVNKSANLRYLLFISCENNSGERISSRNLVDANVFFESLPDIDLVETSLKFSLNPDPDKPLYVYEESQTAEFFQTDDIVSNIVFYTDKAEQIILQRIDCEILAKDASNEVLLDKISANVGSFGANPTGGQDINVSIQRGFKTDTRKTFSILRSPTKDTVNKYAYDLSFPFWVGWEYWKKAIDNSVPSNIYTPTSPTKGIPNNWSYYPSVGYTCKFRIRYVFEFKGKVYQQEKEYPFNVNNYEAGDWISTSIKAYDESNNEIISSGTKYINGITRIEAEFDRATSPSISDLEAYFMFEDFETSNDSRKTMSVRDNSQKKIEDCVLTKVGTVIKVTGFINSADLTAGKKTVYCRLFEKITPPLPIIGLATSSTQELLTDNSNNAIIES